MQYQNAQKSNVAQQRIASNSFWNQVSKSIGQTSKQAVSGQIRLKDTNSAAQEYWQGNSGYAAQEDPLRDQELATREMERRIRLY